MEKEMDEKHGLDLDEWSEGGKTLKQAVEFTGAGRTTIYEWMKAGMVVFRKHGSRTIISTCSLKRRLAEGSPGRDELGRVDERAA